MKCEALLIGIGLAVVAMLLLCSCTTTKVVTVENVRNDTTFITKQKRDSIWLHDSIHVKERGDTMLIERWHTKYIERVTHDTTYVATHDTIPQPFEVIKMVEKELNWFQKAFMTVGMVAIIALLIAVAMWLKKRKII